LIENIPLIAADIHQKPHWVPPKESIYLIMDNAGGRGTQDAIEEYTRRLLQEFNIVIIRQSVCSPEVDALDLGVWMSVQSHAKRRHRGRCRDPYLLAISIEEAWNNLPIETVQQVFNRILIVLEQIVKCSGDNVNVEERRGHCNMVAAPE
jgi:hypothetical protein